MNRKFNIVPNLLIPYLPEGLNGRNEFISFNTYEGIKDKEDAVLSRFDP